ncbi:MAG: hypothetical protein VB022_02335 [Rikenellaceae bacterium]|nr:hypothetical protein [Rikenellaceae bacterium]
MKNKFTILLSFVSFFIFCFILANWKKIPDDSLLLLFLPFIYSSYLFFGNLKRYIAHYFSLLIYTCLAFIRYVITPLFMLVFNTYDVLNSGGGEYLFNSYLLMIYELLFSIVVLEILFSKLKTPNETVWTLDFYKYPTLFLKVSIIIGFFGIFINPSFIERLYFFNTETPDFIPISGWYNGVLFYFVKFIQIMLFFIILKHTKLNLKSNNLLKYLPLFFIIILNIAFVWSANRASIVVTALSLGYVMIKSFPQKTKTTVVTVVFLIIILTLSSTTLRKYNTTSISIAKSLGFKNDFWGEGLVLQLDAYLSGPSSIAVGLKVHDLYQDKWSIKTLINDLIINTNILSQLSYKVFDTNLSQDRTSVYYNNYLMGSYIPPLIFQGYIFLGEIFSPAFTVFSILLMFYFENKSKSSNDATIKYAWLYISIRFAFALGYSIGILSGMFFTYFLPMYIILKINIKAQRKKVKL